MRELHYMHRTDATFAKEIRPVFLGVLVIDAILKVVWQQVLDLDWCGKADALVRINAAGRVSSSYV